MTYAWCCEETFGSTLVGFSKSSHLPQTERFAEQSPATAFWHAQCTVTVLNTAFILPLRQKKTEQSVTFHEKKTEICKIVKPNLQDFPANECARCSFEKNRHRIPKMAKIHWYNNYKWENADRRKACISLRHYQRYCTTPIIIIRFPINTPACCHKKVLARCSNPDKVANNLFTTVHELNSHELWYIVINCVQ